MSDLGTMLRDLRQRPNGHRPLSQARLARRVGLDHSQLSRIESGGRQPSARTLGRLALALDLSADEALALLTAASGEGQDGR